MAEPSREPIQTFVDPQTGALYYDRPAPFGPTNFEQIYGLNLSQGPERVYLNNFGQQMPSQIQPTKVTAPVVSQLFEPMNMQNMGGQTAPMGNAGVSQFLTGQMAIPMQFGVDLPAYESTPFVPGDFAAFMAAQGSANKNLAKSNVSIPVFNPATGTYTAVKAPGVPKG